jgi:hypothetical protein
MTVPISFPKCPNESGGHTYVVHIANLRCGRYMRWLIVVDTHLYKGFCGSGASGWKEQAGSVLMIPNFFFSPFRRPVICGMFLCFFFSPIFSRFFSLLFSFCPHLFGC